MPAGRTVLRVKIFCFASKENLLRLPFGVSIITCNIPSSSWSIMLIWVGSARPFLLFFAMRHAPQFTEISYTHSERVNEVSVAWHGPIWLSNQYGARHSVRGRS